MAEPDSCSSARGHAGAETRVRGINIPWEGCNWASTLSSPGRHLEFRYTYDETVVDRQKVTNLRLPGQYDERLLGSLGLQGPYYNQARWYLPGIGRYLELDPMAIEGRFNTPNGPDWYGYAGANPLSFIDRTGLAFFAKRRLKPFPWLGPFSCNATDDANNTEISHEQLFFEDGKSPSSLGFFDDGTLHEEPYSAGYHRCDSNNYNDCIMRKAAAIAPLGKYKTMKPNRNNCQDWADRVREAYNRLKVDPQIQKECGGCK